MSGMNTTLRKHATRYFVPGQSARALYIVLRCVVLAGAWLFVAGAAVNAQTDDFTNPGRALLWPEPQQFGIDTASSPRVTGARVEETSAPPATEEAESASEPDNYTAAIGQGGILIFSECLLTGAPIIAHLPVDTDRQSLWQVPAEAGPASLSVYRATEANGLYEPVAPLPLQTSTDDDYSHGPASAPTGCSPTLPTTAAQDVQTVAVAEGSDGQEAAAQGSASGALVVAHEEDAAASGQFDGASPQPDWFVVGQADLTLGRSRGKGPARSVSGERAAEGRYATGRLAFYAKGETNSRYRITASADTGEESLQDLFTNLDRKDPAQLLRRTRTVQHYPVYGDSSTLVEDAPTQGRFYLRVEKDESQLVVGNFIAQATGTELVQLDRGLFGGMINLQTPERMDSGEARGQLFGFVSEPGTVPAREEFRGTGGSLYLLKRQDVSVGSERVRVEIRERTSGEILESYDLRPHLDYDFDPFQGRLLLLRPLSSIVPADRTVRDGSAGGNIPVLVVRYEYTPVAMSLGGRTIGARGARWIGEHVRLGGTFQDDGSGEADQLLIASDIFLRAAEGTYLKAEIAQSKGAGAGQSNSVDGGLSFFDFTSPGRSRPSHAWRAELAVDLAELNRAGVDRGTVSAYFESLEQGFSSAGRLAGSDTSRWGARFALPFGSESELAARADAVETSASGANIAASLDLQKRMGLSQSAMIARGGLSLDDRSPGLLFNSTQQGRRIDLAADVEYLPDNEGWSASLFGQVTLDRDQGRARNNRAGAGIHAALSERLSLDAEISGGDGGFGMDLKLNRRLDEGSETYLGYTVFTDLGQAQPDPVRVIGQSDGPSLIAGSRHRISDQLSLYGENRFAFGATMPSVSRLYGLSYEPDNRLSVTVSLESGQIDDAQAGVLQRTAASVGVGFAAEHYRVASAVEVRQERGHGKDQEVWLLRNSASYSASEDWTYLGEFNIARADADTPSIRAAEFTETTIGLAYRPVTRSRLNGLVRLHYFEDLGPLGQLSGSGGTESPKQVSTIFSADGNYKITQRLTLGAKYGYRQGRVSLGRGSDDFVRSDAHLAILRADYNVAASWDVLAEARVLQLPGAEEHKLGLLAAVYRHLTETVKLGLGYSWSDFSDNLSDQSYTSRGAFLNLVAAF